MPVNSGLRLKKTGEHILPAIFTLILLAALIGLIKPYLSSLNRKHFAGIAVASFIGLALTAPTPAPDKGNSDNSSSGVANAPESTTGSSQAAKPQSKWSYSEEKDSMRGTTSRYASLESENEVDLSFPYGTQKGELLIRRNPEQGLDVMFRVGKGQILCNAYSNTYLSVKFDNGPIQRIACTDASDGSSETAFFRSASRVLNGLKVSKRAVIEAEFYQQGRQQFVFDTAGLEWK